MVFAELRITCLACPLQIEGRWGAVPFYYRARHGRTELRVGPAGADEDAAVEGELAGGLPHDDQDLGEALSWIAKHLGPINFPEVV